MDREKEARETETPETEKALQMLLEILAKNPKVADRITITIKPNSKPQGTGQK